MATLSNRFTRTLNVRHPIVSAPMAFAGGGALAAAVSRAGGLGLIGGGYGDPAWIEAQFEAAGLIEAIEPAALIIERMVDEAVLRLNRYGGASVA